MSSPLHPVQMKLLDAPMEPPKAKDKSSVGPSGPYLPPATGNGGFASRTPSTPPQQLPMFMSARDIKSQYQPNDPDRQDSYDWREGEMTNRSRMTATSTGKPGYPNQPIKTNDQEWLGRQWGRSSVAEHTHYRDYGPPETDSQVWSRKLEESQLPIHEYNQTHGGALQEERTPGWETLMGRSSAPTPPSGYEQSAWDAHDAHEAMYVQRKQEEHRAVHGDSYEDSLYGRIDDAMKPGGEGFTSLVHLGTQFGMSGKPQIAGGHHRIAAMNEIAPDRLLPVLHQESVLHAKKGMGKSYKYT